MNISTDDRSDLTAIADRIAADVDTATALPADAIALATQNSGQRFAYLTVQDSPLHRPDRTDWPRLAAWLRNIGQFIDELPDGTVYAEDVVPEFVWTVGSRLVVDGPDVITWWSPAALDTDQPDTTCIGSRFAYALSLLIQGDPDPREELDGILDILRNR